MINANLLKLKKVIGELKLDYFLLPNADEFNSEYLPEYAKRLSFISGFTGSNGFAIISSDEQKKSAFFTDGRYTIQASIEVNQQDFEIFNLKDKTPLYWLLENAKEKIANEKIGFDGQLHSISAIKNYQQHFGDNLICLEQNPVDQIWQNQPKKPETKVFEHQKQYCGISSDGKIKEIIATFNENSEALILTNPASICWLFNLRASDVLYSPLKLTYAIIYKNGEAKLLNPKADEINLSIKEIKNIELDFSESNFWLYNLLKKNNVAIINKPDACLIKKSIKNQVEIKNAIIAHKIDGLALTRFLFWLDKSIKEKQKIDEIIAEEKLLEFRKKDKRFIYPSFATIAGFGSNGAIIHYKTSPKTNQKFRGNSVFLIDSGGQYKQGTTDITRTIAFGKPKKEIIENFTRVLKGHIAIARAKFPLGTTGNDLDILARYNLWQKGLNYDHGTGHGVGSFSSVHESPPSISKRNDGVALQAGMILSNEPGYYKAGEYGIRIENLLLVEKLKSQKNINKDLKGGFRKGFSEANKEKIDQKEKGETQFLNFKTISLSPIDNKLINFKMLTYPEKKWLYQYHLRIFKEFKLKLNEQERDWLKQIVLAYQA